MGHAFREQYPIGVRVRVRVRVRFGVMVRVRVRVRVGLGLGPLEISIHSGYSRHALNVP